MIPQRFPCGQSGGKCFVAVLEQEQTDVKCALCEQSRGSFPGFCDDDWEQPDLEKKKGAKKEHVLKISLLAKIFTVLTAGPCVDRTISICPRGQCGGTGNMKSVKTV